MPRPSAPGTPTPGDVAALPTRRQLDALGACLDAGSIKEAAYARGITYFGMRSALARLYRQIGVETLAQAVAWADQNVPGWRREMG